MLTGQNGSRRARLAAPTLNGCTPRTSGIGYAIARVVAGSSASTAKAATAVTSQSNLTVDATFAPSPAARPPASRQVAYTDSTCSKPTHGDSCCTNENEEYLGADAFE
jgi:hypothetical protein